MLPNRLFLSQDALDRWVADGRGAVEGDVLTDVHNGQRFHVATAVLFVEEVSGAADEANLVGRVKDIAQLAELGAEHLSDSVILGDNAYRVREGVVGTPVLAAATLPVADAGRSKPRAATIASLQAFFLDNVK